MTKSLLCRLGRHRWTNEKTADGNKFRRCRQCGKDDADIATIMGIDNSAWPR